jgi:predicted GTPase
MVLKVPFPSTLTGQGAVGAFDLYDTPGTNEGSRGVRALVTSHARTILANADVVVVVLDFSGMGLTQELELLR